MNFHLKNEYKNLFQTHKYTITYTHNSGNFNSAFHIALNLCNFQRKIHQRMQKSYKYLFTNNKDKNYQKFHFLGKYCLSDIM